MSYQLTDEEAEQIAAEIDNEEFGYWVENYAASSLKNHPKLLKLAIEADKAMNALEAALITEGAFPEYERNTDE